MSTPSKSRARILATPIATLIASLLVPASGSAQTVYTWNVAGGGSWGAAGNWAGGVVADGVGNTADFTTQNITAAAAVTLDGNRTIGTLRFADATSATHDWTVNVGSPTTSTITLDVTSGRGIIDVTNRQATINPVIAGNDGFQKDGLGTLRLNGANTWTGDIAVNGGVLQVGNNAAISTLGNTINVNFNTGAVGGNGTTLFLLDNITLAATKTVNLITGGSNNRASLLGQNGAVQNGATVISGTSPAGLASSAGTFTVNGNVSGTAGGFFMRGAGTGVINGSINVGNTLVKTDAGTWIINTTGHSWANFTHIADGQLQLGINDAFPTTLPVVIGQASATNGRLEMNGFNQTVTGLRTDGASTGTGHIIRNSNLTQGSTLNFNVVGTDILKNTHVQRLGDLTLVKGGTGRFELQDVRLDSTLLNVEDGVLAFTGNSSSVTTSHIAGSSLAFVEKLGTGTLSVAGEYRHSGLTSVINGRLNLGAGSAGSINVGDNTTLGVGLNGGALTATAVAFGNVGVTNLSANLTASEGAPLLTVGSLSTAGVGTAVTFEGTDLVPGIYPLISYGGTIGGNGFLGFGLDAPGTYPHSVVTLVDNAVAKRIDLDIASVDTLIWTGASGNVWDVNLTPNFKLASDSTTATFWQGDRVLFDDLGANRSIAITGTPRVGTLSFANSAGIDYVVMGALAGPGGILKTGSGVAGIGAVGASNIAQAGGIVTVTTANPHGYATGQTVTIANSSVGAWNGSFVVTVVDPTTFTYTQATTGTNANASVITALANTNHTFTGPITVMDGVLVLGGSNTGHGEVTIAAGTLRMAHSNAISGGAPVRIFDGGTLDVNGMPVGVRIPHIEVVGTGADGNGAIVNNGVAITNLNHALRITLGGDTTWGGSGRYDLNATTFFDGGNHTLRKRGTGDMWFTPAPGSTVGNVVVDQGVFGVQSTNPLAATSEVTISAGAIHSVFGSVFVQHPAVVEDGGTLRSTNGSPVFNGTVNLNGVGPSHFLAPTSGTTLNVAGEVTGTGGMTKNDAGTVQFRARSTYGGDTTINAGTLNFGPQGSIPIGTNLIINGGTFDPSNLVHMVSSLSGTGGAISQGTAGTGVITTTQTSATVFATQFNRTLLRMNGNGSLTMAGTTDNSTGTAEVNAGTLILAKTGTLEVHSIGAGGVGLTVNNGGTVQLGALPTGGATTVNNQPPADAPANYTDQIFNLTDVVVNTGGVLDMGGYSEAIDILTGAGTIRNTVLSTVSRLYVGYHNNSGSFTGLIEDGGGSVELTKIGTGRVALIGNSTYTGVTTVNNGILHLDGTFGTGALNLNAGTLEAAGTIAGTVTAAAGTTLNVGAVTGGSATSLLTVSGLTLPTGGQRTLNFDLRATGADRIVTTGVNGLSISGTNQVTLQPGPDGWAAGTFPIFEYNGTVQGAGVSALTLTNVTGHSTVTLIDNGTGAISLQITGGNVKWTGANSSAWDSATTNWNSTDQLFLAGDTVLFDDTAANFAPSIATDVAPGGVTFNNAQPYALSGTAGIAGTGPLHKLGTGTLTISNPNTYTGRTNVVQGTLVADYTVTANPIAAGSEINVGALATARFVHSDADFTIANALSGSGTVVIDPHALASTASRQVIITGNNSNFTGTLNLAPTTGTFRAEVNSVNDLGAASMVDVKDGGQVFVNAANLTLPNNFTITGTGYSETAGQLGALRAGNPTTFTGTVTVAGAAKIGAHAGIGIFTGRLEGGDLTFGGNASTGTVNETMQILGDASTLSTITVNGGSSGGGGTIAVQIGNGITSGDIGSVPVTIRSDSRGGVLRVRQGNDYELNAPITAVGNGSLQLDTYAGTATGEGVTLKKSVNLNGGSLQVGTAAISDGARAKATINLLAGEAISAGSMFLGEQSLKQGTVDHLAGDVTLSGRLQIGHWPNETSVYNLAGGSVNLSAGSPAAFPFAPNVSEQQGGVYLGIDGQGMLNQTGGTLTTNFIVLDNRGNSGVGNNQVTGVDTYALSGGTLVLKSEHGIITRNASTAVNFLGGTIQATTNTSLDSDKITVSGLTTIDTNGNTVTSFGALGGSGVLIVSGTGSFRTADSTALTGGSLGAVNLQVGTGATLRADRTGVDTWSGSIDGLGNFVKTNVGTLTLTGSSPGFAGLTQVNDGTLAVHGSLQGSAVTVSDAGTLSGNGIVGALTVHVGGTLAPGAGPGLLDAGSTVFNGGTFAVELNGVDVESEYDQLSVTGPVSFAANTELALTLGFAPAVGQSFTILSNDLSDAVDIAGGAFMFGGTALADNAVFGHALFTGGEAFRIDYDGGFAGGDNDVVLTVVPEPGSATLIFGGISLLMSLRRLRRRA